MDDVVRQLGQRDRFASRLAELARRLDNPTPPNIAVVQAELRRLATS